MYNCGTRCALMYNGCERRWAPMLFNRLILRFGGGDSGDGGGGGTGDGYTN
jgi:hypothetical protein